MLLKVEEIECLWSVCVLYVVRRLGIGVCVGGDRVENGVFVGFIFF